MAKVPRETKQNYSSAFQRPIQCRKISQDILGNAEMGGLTLRALLSRRCSFWLPLIPIDGTQLIIHHTELFPPNAEHNLGSVIIHSGHRQEGMSGHSPLLFALVINVVDPFFVAGHNTM